MTEKEQNHSDEFSCGVSTLLAKTACILGYAGSTKDVILNYTMVIINLIYCAVAIIKSREQADKGRRKFGLGALIFVFVFQITLCLGLGCVGISIIWCAMGGWIMSERRRVVDINMDIPTSSLSTSNIRLINMGKVVILFDCGVIFYYAIVFEPITTVAHVCALVLGAVLSQMSIWFSPLESNMYEKTSSERLVSE